MIGLLGDPLGGMFGSTAVALSLGQIHLYLDMRTGLSLDADMRQGMTLTADMRQSLNSDSVYLGGEDN